MSNKRVLELAKELSVKIEDVQRAAADCGVSVSDSSSILSDADTGKIKTALKKPAKPDGAGKTLTLGKPAGSGQGRGTSVDGRGHTVQVAVRRRRAAKPSSAVTTPTPAVSIKAPSVAKVNPAEKATLSMKKKAEEAVVKAAEQAALKKEAAKKPTPKPTVTSKPTASKKAVSEEKKPSTEKTAAKPAVKAVVNKLSPAKMAAQAVEKKKEEAKTREQEQRNKRAEARKATATQRRGSTEQQRGSAKTNHPTHPNPNRATRPNPNRPTQGNRPGQGNRPVRPNPNRPAQGNRSAAGQQKRTSTGPRTTIRTGLTPAQIAASKAPKSSLKQIEAKITKERSERRRENANRGARPNRNPNGAAGNNAATRRPTPNVAVTPDPNAPAPTAVKRRFGGGGGPQRQQQRRLSPAEKAARRSYSSKRNEVLTPQQEERMARLAKGGRRRGITSITKDDEAFVIREVEITNPIVVSELANRMATKTIEVIKKLMEMGSMVTANDNIDSETALLIVEEFGHKAKVINEAAVEDVLTEVVEEDDELLQPRPPVVVVMGHVDHGKTSILDALRKAHVAEGEAGGITQHIGAYMVKLESGERVVFVDTPGHEAFTSLRARGANLTDVAVLVVAADDGVMPQTVEALSHAKAAGVPIIVAINKMDKDGANPENVKRQLAEHEIIPEEWGGDSIFVEVSAHTGQGLEDLLEMLALQTEVLELKANAEGVGRGVVVESRLDKGRGPVATVLVQNGTFNKGDIVVVGTVTGRIRAIVDENAVQHRTAGPSVPFELLGLESVPEAGQDIVAVANDRQARDIISYRKEKARQLKEASTKRASFDDMFAAVQSDMAEVPVIIKGDVTGSVEAMADSLVKQGTDEVKVKLVHKGIGAITESDIMLASASNAIVIGFNVRPESKAKKLAADHGVDVRFYKVIYDAIDDVRAAMAGELSPDQVEKVTGEAEVRQVIMVPKIGAVAGTYITEGFVTRGSKVRVLRDNVMIYDGDLASLRRFKDDVKEVKAGYECGIGVDKFNDVKEGDSFEFYIIEEIAATL